MLDDDKNVAGLTFKQYESSDLREIGAQEICLGAEN